jgi:anthranilate phosphoribosyltransferase
MLGQEGYQNVGNVCVVAGLADNFECDPAKNLSEQARQFTVLDELTPFNSVISIVREGVFEGNFIISPKDFGISIEVEDILARGTREQCYSDNIKALAGTCQKKAEYLAMNAALVYFTAKFLSREDSVVNGKPNPYHLRAAYEKCLDAIKNGAALSKLNEYVEKTGGKFKNV